MCQGTGCFLQNRKKRGPQRGHCAASFMLFTPGPGRGCQAGRDSDTQHRYVPLTQHLLGLWENVLSSGLWGGPPLDGLTILWRNI